MSVDVLDFTPSLRDRMWRAGIHTVREFRSRAVGLFWDAPFNTAEARREIHHKLCWLENSGLIEVDELTSIEFLDFSIRTYNCLKRDGIHTVGQLADKTEAHLRDIRNLGDKSMDEIRHKLLSVGMVLKK